MPNDPALAQLWPTLSRGVTIESSPPDARVSYIDYEATDSRWKELGSTPLPQVRVPRAVLRLRVEKEGFVSIDDAIAQNGNAPRAYTLDRPESVPTGMVRVSADLSPVSIFIPGLDGLPPTQLPSFWIDKFEVTNRQFKTFVDGGGYQKREYWQEGFVRDGRSISWDEAMAVFHDATGRPGPAGWELGDYPSGQADFPVTGVSWYEAAAFARFSGKALPSIFHWSRAAMQNLSGSVVPLSNFAGKGLAAVGDVPRRASLWRSRHGGKREGMVLKSRRWRQALHARWCLERAGVRIR